MNIPRKPDTPILAGLICFGIAAIVLGAMHLGRVIKPPRATVGTYQSPEDLEAQQRIALATLDTDKDTLPDLDELERTFTSPYLADSDSDGVDDAKELAAGTDPNCPTGQECASIFRAEAIPERTSGLSPSVRGGGDQEGVGSDGAFDPLKLLTGALGAQSQISNLKSQIPSEGVGNGLDLKSQISNSSAAPPFDITTLLKNLPSTATEIRTALKQNGIPDSQLQQIDDATLLELWSKSLNDLKTTANPSP